MLPSSSRNGHHVNGSNLGPAPRFTVPSPNGGDGLTPVPPPSPNGGNAHATAAPPSPNGDSRTAAGPPPSPNGEAGRDARGRFAKGNRGGPGNPFARRVGRLRSLLLDQVSDDDLAAIAKKLVEQARAGDIAAARLVLAYTVGKPAETVDPDRLDLDEWRLCKEAPTAEEFEEACAQSVPAEVASGLAQAVQEHNAGRILEQALQEQAARAASPGAKAETGPGKQPARRPAAPPGDARPAAKPQAPREAASPDPAPQRARPEALPAGCLGTGPQAEGTSAGPPAGVTPESAAAPGPRRR